MTDRSAITAALNKKCSIREMRSLIRVIRVRSSFFHFDPGSAGRLYFFSASRSRSVLAAHTICKSDRRMLECRANELVEGE
jgi:hypothetical protein